MPHEPHTPLSKEQKVGFSLLLIFAFLVVGMGTLQLRNTIYGPFAYNAPDRPALTQTDIQEQEVLRLQAIDTDQDGINDYEEINFYQTSPYLPDTDSDGVSDKEEIDAGTDPLCPEGRKCNDEVVQKSVVSPPGIPMVTSSSDILSLVTGGQNSLQDQTIDADDVEAFLNNPEQIRAFILQTGKISEEDLKKISDEDLLEIIGGIAEKQQPPQELESESKEKSE